MVKKIILSTFVVGSIFYSSFLQAGLNLWSKDSTLQIANSSALNIESSNFQVRQGSLVKDRLAIIHGNPVIFNGGTYESGDLEILLTALYDFDASYPIILNGDKSFKANAGIISDKIWVEGENNRLEGQPIWTDSSGVTLKDFHTTLTVAIQNALNTNIVLNNGVLVLENDLRLGDDILLTSSGQIRCFGHKVLLGAKPLSWPGGNITWSDTPVVQLNNNVILDGRWTFSGVSSLTGNGSILDFSSGKIRVRGDGPLYINNVKLKGFGSGKFEFDRPNSQIRFSNVEIEMNSDYTFTSGGIYVDGGSAIVTKGNIINFDSVSSLTVDGVVLNYETLSVLDSNNIQPTRDLDPNSKHVALLNGGLIRRIIGVQVGPLVLNPPTPFQTIRISENLNVAPTKELIIANDLTFDGSTNAMVFAKSQNPLLIVQPGKTLVLKNVLLQDFNFNYLNLGLESKIIFDNKSKIVLNDSQSVNTTYTFRGDTIIDGQGKILTFDDGGGIELHSSIKFENAVLYGISGSQLAGWDDSSTMTFQNVTLYLDDNFTLTKGHFEVIDSLDVVGTGSFIYSTDKSSIIWERATMTIGANATFYYNPPVADRDLIIFKDDRSIFALNGGTLVSSTTGMRLLGGTFQVENDAFVAGSPSNVTSESIEFGDGVNGYNDCIINLISSANMYVLSGAVNYNNVLLQ
ncbi:MAG: hypothetical protein US49_C0006G0081 [candidate division TM6 bacterium GW2011_GWF2_37_49]|nr:MAG: hypothetical protein US49_C0006G0081 [candidate division TM6 bacterium GW2011_GWF2_37_49]